MSQAGYRKTAASLADTPVKGQAPPPRDPGPRLLESFLRRLEVLGASADEMQATRDGWDVFDEEWTPDYRLRLATSPDAVLITHLERTRREYHAATTTEEEAELERLVALETEANAGAANIIARAIPEVLEWVKSAETEEVMLARSYAVLVLEDVEGRRRKGVMGVIEPYAKDWDARMIDAEAAAGVEAEPEPEGIEGLLAAIDDAEPFDPTPSVEAEF